MIGRLSYQSPFLVSSSRGFLDHIKATNLVTESTHSSSYWLLEHLEATAGPIRRICIVNPRAYLPVDSTVLFA